MAKARGSSSEAALLETLGDFTSKENWDKFFTIRGTGDSFEWYADWVEFRKPLLGELHVAAGRDAPDTEILVPGCGSSRLSERLYDAGFRRITNVDFSKVVIADMLRRHARDRPEMKWRVMDMTKLQFPDEIFDIVLDKGGLDALMEPEVGSELGIGYMKEVKRVLKTGGKFICFTLAESHVLGVLFAVFRFSWELRIQAIPNKVSGKSNFQTFMITASKGNPGTVSQILFVSDHHLVNADQTSAVENAIKSENTIRDQYPLKNEMLYSLQDLQLGALGNLKVLTPGRRNQLILGNDDSVYSYKAVLLDAQKSSGPFTYHCGIFIVPKTRSHEWLFTSEEGQWLVVESSKVARLVLVFLDLRHSLANMDVIQKDLSPLVKNLAPEHPNDDTPIPFMMASDGIKQRNIVKQVTSEVTGTMTVEDVVYENENGDHTAQQDVRMFRRLIFERNVGLVQSEALLVRDTSKSHDDMKQMKKAHGSKKSRCSKKGNSIASPKGHGSNLKIDHSCLASTYHNGIISGFALISSALNDVAVSEEKLNAVIIGLGAGLFPMFLRGCLPFAEIEVVELDPVVLDVAKEHFGLIIDEQLKVHIGDGIQFIKDRVGSCSDSNRTALTTEKNDSCSNGRNTGIRVLIVDADSSDPCSGLTCPPEDFVQESFLLVVKHFLSGGGLFVINLVSRSPSVRELVVSRLKKVFDCLYSLQLDEDVNEVLFASPTTQCINESDLPASVSRLKMLASYAIEGAETVFTKLQKL